MSCELSQMGNASFPPKYIAQNPAYDDVVDCAIYASFEASDARQDPSVVGTRISKEGTTETHSISINGNLMGAVTAGVEKAFEQARLRKSDASNAAIKLTVTRLSIDEKTLSNSDYEGKIVFDVLVVDRRNQSVVWQSRKTGHSNNWGRPGTEIAYQETLSRSLEDALAQILRDPEFGRALCSVAAGAEAQAPPTAATS